MTRARRHPRVGRSPLWPALILSVAACDGGATPGWGAPAAAVESLPDSTFASLVERLSESGGFFDTDNLISNESSYLHVVGKLEEMGLRGGAFIGVGPDQSFSYMASVEPEIAFMVDIRRDNLLQHLLYKALFQRSPTRVEFLANLFGRPVPDDPGRWHAAPPGELLAYVENAPPDGSLAETLHREIARAVAAYGVPLDEADQATIRRFHQEFIDHGPALRFTSYGRPPRPYYPTYRQLVVERDLMGRQASFLSTRARYEVVRGMEEENRVVPVVGDLAGSHALREIGRYLEETGVPLTVMYVSNVEFYLWRSGTFGAFTDNVAVLPAAPEAVIIRSIFRTFGGVHPHNVRGYYSTQSLQTVASLVAAREAGGYASYYETVTRDAIDPR